RVEGPDRVSSRRSSLALALRVAGRLVLGIAPAGLLPGAIAAPAAAQQPTPDEIRRQIQESQRRLQEVREERARLQGEMEDIRSRVQDVSGQLQNIERQLSASRSVLAEIEFQLDATTAQVQEATRDLLQTREELRERQAVLHGRLRSIYKRGPLFTARVLLGADSFTDLLNRIHYLQMIATYDRSLVTAVRSLEDELEAQGREMRESLAELDRLRQHQMGEVAELRQVEAERQQTLSQFRTREQQARTRLDELEAAEGRLTGLVSDLERRRIEAERRAADRGADPAGPGALAVGDMGSLDWPVDGELAYRFGREQRPNGTVLRWNGIGIRAPLGTPVRAVRGGVVALAGPFEGYGPTVILSHGDGFYTLYLYLDEVGVVEGREVAAGQVVGTVGGGGTFDGPHIEFQVRAPVRGGTPQAQDPLQWLRPRDSDR
ncbi:MAG: murein hydrolase activator EnvC family protein, partial [Acidobacteriota bacterium]